MKMVSHHSGSAASYCWLSPGGEFSCVFACADGNEVSKARTILARISPSVQAGAEKR
jgi:hypothetical protein